MPVSGINRDAIDTSIRPQDDLYRHTNGKWIANTEIPSDKPSYGAFIALREQAEEVVHEIITGKVKDFGAQPVSVATDLQKISKLYSLYMDEHTLTQLGATPLQPLLAQIDAVSSLTDLVRLSGVFARLGHSSLAELAVRKDPGNPQRYVLFIAQSGIGLPDESYYRAPEFAEIREKYVAHIARMLTLAGLDDTAERATRIYTLETKIAKYHWSRAEKRDIHKIYNLRTFAQLQAEVPQINWQLYLHQLGMDEISEVVLAQPSALAGFAQLLGSEPLAHWQDWLRWAVVRANADSLSPEIAAANFDFYGTVLQGVTEIQPRWRRAVGYVQQAMGEAIGRLYVAKHFDERKKPVMDELVAYLIAAYRDSITNLDWMSAETRGRALEKLGKFVPKIGYPVKWRDYSNLKLTDSLFANGEKIAEFFNRIAIEKLGAPIDPDEWMMTPQTVNAYYSPTMNEIVFPAAILQPPFFNIDADMATNFGAIGAVIGHEIGHGFDDQGSRYNGDGQLQNWWTDADRAAFEARTGALIAQYDALSPAGADGKHVNGQLTVGENIGDLGGLSIAWKAYLHYLADQGLTLATAPVIDSLTAAERFFLSWAQCWQKTSRPEETVRLLTVDPHSPNEFRCNQIVRNLPEFHTAFGTTPTDALWLDPAERVKIW